MPLSRASQPLRMHTTAKNNERLVSLKESIRQAEVKLTAQAQVRQFFEARISTMASWLLTLAVATAGANVWLDSVADKEDLSARLKDFQPVLSAGATAAGAALIVNIAAWGTALCLNWHYVGPTSKRKTDAKFEGECNLLGALHDQYSVSIRKNAGKLATLQILSAAPMLVLWLHLPYVFSVAIPAISRDLSESQSYLLEGIKVLRSALGLR